jgi:hypothetical protein
MKTVKIFALFAVALLFGCMNNDEDIIPDDQGASTINVQISAVGFADQNSSRASRNNNNITWNHIFGGSGTMTFTNTSTVTPIDSVFTVDMADFALNGFTRTLINGNYDVDLTMADADPVPYVPVSATDQFTLSGSTSLVLDANTTYGMVLLNPYLVDANVTPTFTTGGTDYNLSEDQGYYYLYIPDGVTGTVTLQESLFGQTVSREITIATTTIDALELVPVTSSAGVSLTLEEFTVEFDSWDIDAPVSGITSSFGLFTDSGQALGSADAHDVALGDLDGDGDLDALVINRVQNSQVWLNDGSGNFSNGQSLGTNDSVGASLEDVDGDGDLDVFIVNNSNQPNEVWLNDGNGSFSNSGQSLGNQSSTDVFLGDFDGDGDADAFVTNSDNASNTVWFNDGTGVFTQSSQIFPTAQSSIVSMGDFDGDGDLDAMLGSNIQANQVWFNDGNGTFTDSGQSIWNTNAGTQEIAIGDLDNDGDLDVYIVSGSNNPNSIWFNDGSGTFTDGGQFIYSNQATGVKLNDLDGDGDLDAFVVYFDRPNQVWLNDGSGVFTDNGQLLGNSYSDGVAIGDLDGDGDLDAFVAERNQPNKVWINN